MAPITTAGPNLVGPAGQPDVRLASRTDSAFGPSVLRFLFLILHPVDRRREFSDILAQSRRQVDLVFLLVHQDLADMLGHRELAQRLALTNAFAVVAYRSVLVLQVKVQH